MADSKRLAIAKALTDHLSNTVTTANGYKFDLTGNVYRGRKKFGTETLLPAIAVLENFNPDREPSEVGGFTNRQTKYTLIFLLNGWAEDRPEFDSENHPADAVYELMADVKKALGILVDHGKYEQGGVLEGLVEDIKFEPGVVRPADETSERAYFWLRVQLEVTEKVQDPYDRS